MRVPDELRCRDQLDPHSRPLGTRSRSRRRRQRQRHPPGRCVCLHGGGEPRWLRRGHVAVEVFDVVDAFDVLMVVGGLGVEIGGWQEWVGRVRGGLAIGRRAIGWRPLKRDDTGKWKQKTWKEPGLILRRGATVGMSGTAVSSEMSSTLGNLRGARAREGDERGAQGTQITPLSASGFLGVGRHLCSI